MAAEGAIPSQHSIFSIEFYKQFFNVDASIVRERIVSAMIPRRAPINYLKQEIGTNPDLYGPFWIVVTLVRSDSSRMLNRSIDQLTEFMFSFQIFSIAISGNIFSYLNEANPDYKWRYNFHLVSFAATTIICYICFIPLALWGAFKWTARSINTELVSDEAIKLTFNDKFADFKSNSEFQERVYTPSLLTLICIYGYSLGIYIPVSVLWLIQISVLQWLLVFSAALTTGAVLIMILSPALQNSSKSVFLIGGVLIAHLLLATSFLRHFFHIP